MIRDHPSLSAMSPFDRAHTTSYSFLIETIRLSCTVYEIYPSIGLKSLYFDTPLAFNAPWDDLRKILYGGQRMASAHSREEILLKGSTSCVGCTNVTDRQTDDRQTELRQQRPERNVVTFG